MWESLRHVVLGTFRNIVLEKVLNREHRRKMAHDEATKTDMVRVSRVL